MDHKELQVLFDNGVIKEAHLQPYPMASNSWTISIDLINGSHETVTLHRSKEPKIFKSITAANNLALKIGLKEMKMHLR